LGSSRDKWSREIVAKSSFRNDAGTRVVMAKAVGTCRQAGRGADGRCAVDRLGRVVGVGRAAAAEGGATGSLSGSEAVAGSAGAAGDLVRAAHGDLVAASAARARLRLRRDLLAADGRVAEGRGL